MKRMTASVGQSLAVSKGVIAVSKGVMAVREKQPWFDACFKILIAVLKISDSCFKNDYSRF